jgi:hypothetical protein
VQERKSANLQYEYRRARVQLCRSAGVQGCMSARVQDY